MPLTSTTSRHFDKGDRVEVLRGGDDVASIWFPAIILRSSPASNRRNQIYVEFETLRETGEDGEPFREYVDVTAVRPAPPRELHRCFIVGEIVEAFYGEKKGWRKGQVLDILENSKYAVSFGGHGVDHSETIVEEVEQWGMRVYRDWDDGSWVPPLQLKKISSKEDVTSSCAEFKIKYNRRTSVAKFSKGMVVEVKGRDEGVQRFWYPAAIVESLACDCFLVEFQTLKAEDKSAFLKEEVDISHIRPCPPEIQSVDPFECFAHVDAWYKDGWCPGHIFKVIDGLKYIVSFGKSNKEMEFEHSKLRPHHEWVEGQWISAPKTSIPEMQSNTKNVKIRVKCSGNTLVQFTKGMVVEVKSDEEGYQGSWYTAVIVGPLDGNKYLVEYQTLRTDDESELLKETAGASHIRPHPPQIQQVDCFKMLEEVDAWYNEGWWVGLISKVLCGLKYAVYFWTTNEELEFNHYDLRPHQEWIGGKWVTSFKKKSKLLLKSKLGKLKGRNGGASLGARFRSGAKIEVKSDEEGYRGSWYPAVMVGPVRNGKYLVQYQTLKTDDETELLKEEADALCIRPCPPVVQQTYQFKPLEEVDAWYNDGWWVGQVCKVLPDSKYTVYFRTSNEVLEFQHSDLRPHQDWINQQWIHTARGRMLR